MSATVKVDITQLPHAEGLALPAYQSADAAGLDLLAAVPAETPLILTPGKYAMVSPVGTIAYLPGGRINGASTGTAASRSSPAASAL